MSSNQLKSAVCAAVLAAVALALAACGGGTKIAPPPSNTNPPPAAKFSDFKTIDLRPIVVAPEFAEAEANQKATKKIQEILDANMSGVIASWNSTDHGATRGTLVIEPLITRMKFIGGGARFMVGAMAGNSAVLMEITCKEAETGQEIAKPMIYQRANAMVGGMSVGGADNAMLTRVAQMMTDYIKSNFDAAVGGPTGSAE
jgi:hypothetical protein